MNKVFVLILSIPLLISFPERAYSLTYHCYTTAKYGFDKIYTQEELEKGKFSVRLEENEEEAYVLRCSYAPSQKAVTCDRYKVDRVETSQNGKIKKYYYFRGQYNFQTFSTWSTTPDTIESLEDNGRGSVQYGICKMQ